MRKSRISLNRILSVFSSMKTAVVLIIILIILSLAGSLIPQGRESEFYTATYGENIGKLLLSVHFDKFFRSFMFLFFSGLFFINLALCSVIRLYRRIKRKAPLRLGPDIIHFSLLLIMILGLVSIFTRQETQILLGVGDSFRLPDGQEVTLTAFDIEYYEDGRPKDWISRIVLTDDESQEYHVEVNKPLDYGAYNIFQSSFDIKPYAVVNMDEHEYELSKRDGLPLKSGSIFFADIRSEEGLENGVFFFTEDNKSDNFQEVILKPGERYEEIEIKELYTVRQSGLLVVYQPWKNLILAVLLIFCVGLALTFYQKLGDKIQ